LVLEEPRLGRHVELEAVGGGGSIATCDVPLCHAVPEDDDSARLVGRLVAGVRGELPPHRVRDYHQTDRSIVGSTSAASQQSAERYFQPPSARTQTTTPSSSSSAIRRAACTTAPDETPPSTPSRSRSSLSPPTASAFVTRSLRSSRETSRIGGT